MPDMSEEKWIDVFVNDPSIESMKIAADWFEERGDSAAQLLRWMIKRHEDTTSNSVYRDYIPMPSRGILSMENMWWWVHYFHTQVYYPYDLPPSIYDLTKNLYPSPQKAWRAALDACRIVMRRDGCIE